MSEHEDPNLLSQNQIDDGSADQMMVRKYVRANLIKAVFILMLLFLITLVIGFYFESSLMNLSRRLFETTGPGPVGVAVFLNDLVISPIPPDIFIWILAKGKNHGFYEFSIVLYLGFCSAAAGNVGWFLGRKLKANWFGPRIKAFLLEKHDMINKYGKWGVALGALTPLPFSITCWAAGFVKMSFSVFFWMTLLRIPRFVIYFYVLIFSTHLSSWIKSLLSGA